MITSIGEFEIKSELGRGGMGTVYLAHDPRVGRDVAIKVLTNEGDQDLLARFRSEAGTTAKLTHKNIVTIYAFGEQEGMPYIVMELLPGENLGDVIGKRRPLTLLEKVRILQQVAEGLSFAHQKNVIHRDIKPRNIMLLPDGTAKVMDFGIARVTGSDSTRRTQKGYLLGTIAYMAPEQFTRGTDADQLVDIFAYGDVAYELIAGKHPFGVGDAGALISRITSAEPIALQTLAPDCPEMLASIIQQLLAKDRDLRYQDLKDLLLDLEQVLFQLRRDRAAQILAEAYPLVEQGQLDAALAKAKEAVELDPVNREADQLKKQLQEELRRGLVRAKVASLVAEAERKVAQRSFSEAIPLLESALQLDKADAIRERLEAARREQNKLKRAVQLLGEAKRQADLRTAIAQAVEALEIDPHNTQAPQVLKRLSEELERRERRLDEALQAASACAAKQIFDEAFGILDQVAEEQGELPEIAAERERVRTALAEFKLTQRQKSFDEGMISARTAMNSGDLAHARSIVESLAAAYADLPRAPERSKILSEELGLRERAAEIARITREARELVRQEQFASGHSKLGAALARYPGDPELQAALKNLLQAKAARERADAIAVAAARIGQLHREGSLESALQAAQEAAREYPDYKDFKETIAQIAGELQERLRHAKIDEVSRRATAMLESDPFQAEELLQSTLKEVGPEANLESLLTAAQRSAEKRREEQAVDGVLAKVRTLRASAKLREAVQELEQAIVRYPGRSELRLAASEVRLDLARMARAEKLGIATQAIQKALAEGDLHRCGRLIDEARKEFRGQASIEGLALEFAGAQRAKALASLTASVRQSLSRDDVEGAARELATSSELLGATAEWKALKAKTDERQGLAKARALLASKSFDEAFTLLTGLHAQYPDSADLQNLKAEVHKRKAESERSERLLRSLSSARERILQKDYANAIRNLESLEGEFPNTAEVADLLAYARQAEQAERHAQRIAEIERETERRLEASDIAGAAAVVKEALALYPADAAITRIQARVVSAAERVIRNIADQGEKLLAENRFPEAATLLDNAVQEHGKEAILLDLRSRVDLAWAAWKQDQARQAAIADIRQLLEKDQIAEAISSIQQALTAYPADSELRGLLYSAHERLAARQRAEAVSRLSQEIEAQLAAGQLDRAQAAQEGGIRKFPGEPALEALGPRIAAAQKVAARRRALQKIQDSIQNLLQAGRFHEALEQVEAALKQDPDKDLVRLKREIEIQWEREKLRATLAQAREHLEAGRLDQAIALLEAAARERSNSAEIMSLLSNARERQKAAETRAAIDKIMIDGAGLAEAGRLEEALKMVEQGCRRHANEPGLLRLRDTIAERVRVAAEIKKQAEERERKLAEQRRLEAERQRELEEQTRREEVRKREEAERARQEAERKRQEEETRKRREEEERLRAEADRRRREEEDRQAADVLEQAGKLRKERATAAALKLIEEAIARLGSRPALDELQKQLLADQARALSARQTLERARAALENGQIDVATQLASSLETTLAGEVDTADLRASIAAKVQQQKVRAAIEAVLRQAESLRSQGRFEEALRSLDEGLREYPGAPVFVSARDRIEKEYQAFLREQARKQALAEISSLPSSAQSAPDEPALKKVVARAAEIAAADASDKQFKQAAQAVSKAAARRRAEWKKIQTAAEPAPASRWRLAIAAGAILLLVIGAVIWKLAGSRGGNLKVSTNPPGANVTVGSMTCTTPQCVLNLPAGSYRIQAQMPGYRAASADVKIGRGVPAPVALTLVPLPMRLLVSANFTRGTVTLDGSEAGNLHNGEFVLDPVPEGTHSLQINGPEGQAALRFEQTAGQPPKILSAPSVTETQAIVISGYAAAAEIRCDCASGEVTVDGKPAGKLDAGHLALPSLATGTHQFRITAPDGIRDTVVALQDNPSVNLFLAADRNVGTLVVEAGQDDVQVFLDNRPLALTHDGIVRAPVPVKQYSVRVEKKGYRGPPAKSVEIKKGELARVLFKLAPLDAVLAIRGALPRVGVLIDGQTAGVTGADGTLLLSNVTPGKHNVELTRNGYSPRRFNLEFPPGATVSLGPGEVELAENRPPPPLSHPPPAPDPRVVEAEEWDRIRNTRNVDQLEEFRRKYPTGSNSDQAARRIEQIEWDNLQNTRDPAAFGAFANKYPNGPHVDQARRRIEDLEWARVDKQNAGQIRAFLQQHPGSLQAPEANAALAALQQAERLAADRRAINQVLVQYQQAFNAKDLPRLLALRPSLKGREENNISKAFKESKSLVLELVPIREAEVSGDTAVVECSQSTRQTLEGRPAGPGVVRVTVTLHRSGQTWTIQDIIADRSPTTRRLE